MRQDHAFLEMDLLAIYLKRKFLSRFVLGLLLQIIFSVVSFASGHLVFFFFGTLLTAASLGMLPGLAVAVVGGALGFVTGSNRFFMLPVDFLLVFLTASAARRNWFRKWKRALFLGLGAGFCAGVISFGLGSWLEYRMVDTATMAVWLTGELPDEQLQLLLMALYHAADVGVAFLIIAILMRFTPSFFLLKPHPELLSKEGVRRLPIRLKIIVNLSIVTFVAMALLFFFVRGIYRQQMVETYGAVARNFVEAASLLVDERELSVILIGFQDLVLGRPTSHGRKSPWPSAALSMIHKRTMTTKMSSIVRTGRCTKINGASRKKRERRKEREKRNA